MVFTSYSESGVKTAKWIRTSPDSPYVEVVLPDVVVKLLELGINRIADCQVFPRAAAVHEGLSKRVACALSKRYRLNGRQPHRLARDDHIVCELGKAVLGCAVGRRVLHRLALPVWVPLGGLASWARRLLVVALADQPSAHLLECEHAVGRQAHVSESRSNTLHECSRRGSAPREALGCGCGGRICHLSLLIVNCQCQMHHCIRLLILHVHRTCTDNVLYHTAWRGSIFIVCSGNFKAES